MPAIVFFFLNFLIFQAPQNSDTGFSEVGDLGNLLLIGCNFPDWLSRFFLRATNQRRLSEKDKRAWLIDPLDAQSSLTCFLRSYSKEIEILSSARPAEFVAELHQRWMAQHGLTFLRISMGIVYLWFGGLKFMPHVSPAEELDYALLRVAGRPGEDPTAGSVSGARG